MKSLPTIIEDFVNALTVKTSRPSSGKIEQKFTSTVQVWTTSWQLIPFTVMEVTFPSRDNFCAKSSEIHVWLHPESQRAKSLIDLVGEKTSSSTICSSPFTPVVDVFLLEVLLWAIEAAFGFAADVPWVVCCDVVMGEFCSNLFGGNTRSAPWRRRLLWVNLQLSLPQVRAREQSRALWPFPKQEKQSLLSATILLFDWESFRETLYIWREGVFPCRQDTIHWSRMTALSIRMRKQKSLSRSSLLLSLNLVLLLVLLLSQIASDHVLRLSPATTSWNRGGSDVAILFWPCEAIKTLWGSVEAFEQPEERRTEEISIILHENG